MLETLGLAGVPPTFFVATSFTRVPVLKYGTEEQIRRFVVPTVTGEDLPCMGMTEPDAGTNSFTMRTSARRDGDAWVIKGQKAFISGADRAARMLLVARTSPYDPQAPAQGMSLFVLDMDTPGITLTRQSIRAALPHHQSQVFFDDVRVPAEALIGEAGKGASYLFDALNPERIASAICSYSFGIFALEKGIAYAKERAPFGSPIGSYQGVAHPMARAKIKLEATRLMIYSAAEQFEAGLPAGQISNMAYYMSSDSAFEAVDAAVQAHGGYAFDEEFDLMNLYETIRLQKIAPINQQMILNYVSEKVLGLPKSY